MSSDSNPEAFESSVEMLKGAINVHWCQLFECTSGQCFSSPDRETCPHPMGVSFKGTDHGDEEWLLKQGNHSTNHGLEACQCAEVVGWVAVMGETMDWLPKDE